MPARMSIETLAIILIAISIGAFAKGLTGIGLPGISIPILTGFLGVEHAVVVMTIPVAVSNVVIVWSYRGLASAVPGLGLVVACAAVGAVIGAYGLVAFDDRVLLWIMVIWLAAFLIHRAISPDFRLEGRAARVAAPFLAVAAGIAQGATGISGPVIATWIHSYRLQAEAYVFGVSALFLAVSAGHLAAGQGNRNLGTLRPNGEVEAAPRIVETGEHGLRFAGQGRPDGGADGKGRHVVEGACVGNDGVGAQIHRLVSGRVAAGERRRQFQIHEAGARRVGVAVADPHQIGLVGAVEDAGDLELDPPARLCRKAVGITGQG